MAEKESSKADYTASAENLCNPPKVMELLAQLHVLHTQKFNFTTELETKNSVLVLALSQCEKEIAETMANIKAAVNALGSYQDLETGEYAVKYRRMSKVYHVEPFKSRYEKYASVVVEETINVKALEGLIKGKLLDPEELKNNKVITETPTFAYFIR